MCKKLTFATSVRVQPEIVQTHLSALVLNASTIDWVKPPEPYTSFLSCLFYHSFCDLRVNLRIHVEYKRISYNDVSRAIRRGKAISGTSSIPLQRRKQVQVGGRREKQRMTLTSKSSRSAQLRIVLFWLRLDLLSSNSNIRHEDIYSNGLRPLVFGRPW